MTTIHAIIMLGLLIVSAPGGISRDRCDSKDVNDGVAILYNDAPIEEVRQVVKPAATFTPDANIVCVQRGNMDYPRKVLAYQVEQGTRDGFSYRVYYSDGSGSVREKGTEEDYLASALWSIGCSVDSMDDSKSCYLTKEHLFIWYSGDDGWSVHVGDGSNYPDTEIAIRIDDGKAINAKEPSFSDEQSRSIVEALAKGVKVRTRFYKWPSGVGDDEFETKGFETSLDLLEWVYESIDP